MVAYFFNPAVQFSTSVSGAGAACSHCARQAADGGGDRREGADLEIGAMRPLFVPGPTDAGIGQYGVSPDGQRFLVMMPDDGRWVAYSSNESGHGEVYVDRALSRLRPCRLCRSMPRYGMGRIATQGRAAGLEISVHKPTSQDQSAPNADDC